MLNFFMTNVFSSIHMDGHFSKAKEFYMPYYFIKTIFINNKGVLFKQLFEVGLPFSGPLTNKANLQKLVDFIYCIACVDLLANTVKCAVCTSTEE